MVHKQAEAASICCLVLLWNKKMDGNDLHRGPAAEICSSSFPVFFLEF